MPDLIKKIQVGSTEYDINAKYIQDDSGNAKTWADIMSKIDAGFEIKVLESLPAADAEAYSTYHNCIVLVPNEHAAAGSYIEYVIQRSAEAPYTYAWEQIGTTATDLSDYVRKGKYTSDSASVTVTGSAGAGTYTTSSAGEQTASGTATVTIAVATYTSSEVNPSTAATTGASGAHTINGSSFGFSGATATLDHAGASASVQLDHHKFTPTGSITGECVIAGHSHGVNLATGTATFVSSIDQANSAGAHTHSVDAHEHGDDVTVVTGLTKGATVNSMTSGGSASFTANTGFAASVSSLMHAPTVSNEGVLSWSLATANQTCSLAFTPAASSPVSVYSTYSTAAVAAPASAKTLTVASAGAHTHSISFSTATASFVTGLTLNSAGGHTVTGSSFGFSGSAVTLEHQQVATLTTDYVVATASVSIPAHTYQPTGSITGSVTVDAHSHSYDKPVKHTHTITTSERTITGTAAVAVASHSHTVTVDNHTHTMGHTHVVSLCAAPTEECSIA